MVWGVEIPSNAVFSCTMRYDRYVSCWSAFKVSRLSDGKSSLKGSDLMAVTSMTIPRSLTPRDTVSILFCIEFINSS